MTVLIREELVALRREVGNGEDITWDTPTINSSLQSSEDVLETENFDATAFVSEAVITNAKAQVVKDALDAGKVPDFLIPVAEFYLEENPATITNRSVHKDAILVFLTTNRRKFAAAVAKMPSAQRDKLIRLVIERRVEAAI